MRKRTAVVAVAVLHALLSIVVLVLAFGASMARFDGGGPPSAAERLLEGAVRVLHFPLVHLSTHAPRHWLPELWIHMAFPLNSLLWAVVLVHGTAWARSRFGSRPAPGGGRT